MRPSDWTEAFLYLANESSSMPGPVRLWPFQREPLNRFDPEDPTQEIVMMTASQLIKTSVILFSQAFLSVCHPAPGLLWLPRDKDVRQYSLQRLGPLIQSSPVLSEIFAESKSRSSANTIEEKYFRGGFYAMLSGNVLENYQAYTARYLWKDEIDRILAELGDEGSTDALARARARNFEHTYKFFRGGTPTIEGASNIQNAYTDSTQRTYRMPCPHCGRMQAFNEERFEAHQHDWWKAWYRCEQCEKEIAEREKFAMLDAGVWTPQREDSAIEGYWISRYYSPDGKWGRLLKEARDAKGDEPKEKAYFNLVLGKPYQVKGVAPDWQIIKGKSEKWQSCAGQDATFNSHGIVPDEVGVLTGSADVHGDRIEVLARGWGQNRESWIVDHHVILGSPAREEVWQQLTDFLACPYSHPFGGELYFTSFGIDSGGHHTAETYDWARRQRESGRVVVLKGQETGTGPISAPRQVDVRADGRKLRGGLKLYHVNTHMLKSRLYGNLRLSKSEEGKFPRGYIHFPSDFDDEFYRQLTAEEYVEKEVRGGFTKMEWRRKRQRNEVLDLMVYADAVYEFARIGMWTPERWAAAYEALRVEQARFDFEPAPAVVPARSIQVPRVTNIAPPPPKFGSVVFEG